MRVMALGLLACCALNLALSRLLGPAQPDPLGMRLRADSAVEDAALFGLGMRRLAADLGLIRMLIYYGTPETPGVLEEEPGSHPFTDREHPEKAWGGGAYRELASRAERVLDIDPGYSYAALYAAGVLAFNLNRADEAFQVLQYALKRDPGNPDYEVYLAAIGLSRHGDKRRVIETLEPVLSEPDCPTMIKNMVASLYKALGEREKAIALYRDIRDNSRDPGYRGLAQYMLGELQPPMKEGLRPAQ